VWRIYTKYNCQGSVKERGRNAVVVDDDEKNSISEEGWVHGAYGRRYHVSGSQDKIIMLREESMGRMYRDEKAIMFSSQNWTIRLWDAMAGRLVLRKNRTKKTKPFQLTIYDEID